MKPFLSLLALIGCLGLPGVTFAQPDYRFEHISTEQGLSQRAIWSIYQDREGFMWFGTMDGLNKYDGYRFTVFKPDPNDPTHSLRHNIITAIHEDHKGRLWVTTYGGGLNQLDKHTGQVTAYPLRSLGRASWNTPSDLYEDAEGMIWVNFYEGLARFNPETSQFKTFPGEPTHGYLQGDPLGHIWYQTATELHRFGRTTGKVRVFPMPTKGPAAHFCIDSRGLLWAGTAGEGLFWADTHTDSIQFKPFPLNGLRDTTVLWRHIYEDRRGLLWVITDRGLLQMNRTTHELVTIPSVPWQRNGLGEGLPFRSILSDRDGNLWIGGFNGIYKLSSRPKPFQTYQVKPTPASVQLGDNRVTSLLVDHTGTTWISNRGNNKTGFSPMSRFFRMDSLHKQATRVVINPNDPDDADQVLSLHEDRKGRIWAGTFQHLWLYNRKTASFTRFAMQGNVFSLTEDRVGKLWFGLWKPDSLGMASFDPSTHHLVKYLYQPYNQTDKVGLKGNYPFAILVSRTNDIWVALDGGGLARLNQKTGQFTNYEADPRGQAGCLNDKDNRALYEDREGIIWSGTNQGGLNRFDPKTGTFTYFTTRNGLPSNHIVSIIGDRHGNLWLGTNNGLCRFNPQTRQVRNFTVNDGLPDNEFTVGTVQQRGGQLVFGTLNGYVVFNPDSIRDNRTIPPVYITNLKVGDKPRSLLSDRIDLSYSENYLSLEFVALNYESSAKNRYAYRLEGVDKDWVYSGTRRFVSYTELSPGNYVFRVKASNNDGIWNETGTALYITIRPPWWRTWWAYLVYSLAFGLVLRAYIVARSRALRSENRVLEEKVVLRTSQVQQQKEEIEAQRDNLEQTLSELQTTQAQLIQKEKLASLGELTAGIAHEIQNPLNFVNNFSEVSTELVTELAEEQQKPNRDAELEAELVADLKQNLQKITHHGHRASSIVKGMLAHARTSTGQKESTDLNALADEYLRLAYQSFRAKDKGFNCELVTHFDPDLPQVEVVPQEIGRVLLNLYNNAFYAVSERGSEGRIPGVPANSQQADYQPTVSVTTRRVTNQSGRRAVELRVKDNGAGIPESVKAKIFQPFFTTKPTGQGTGLGLSLSYDIITQGHGGFLRVTSQEGKGTWFIIELPA